MKKLLFLSIFLLYSCGVKKLQNNFLVNEGMTKAQVISIMGNPVASEFDRGVEEFHYCSTGLYADNFVAFFFKNNKVVSKTSYTVTVSDAGGASGHCRLFIKRGTYRTPDNVIEIRATIN